MLRALDGYAWPERPLKHLQLCAAKAQATPRRVADRAVVFYQQVRVPTVALHLGHVALGRSLSGQSVQTLFQ